MNRDRMTSTYSAVPLYTSVILNYLLSIQAVDTNQQTIHFCNATNLTEFKVPPELMKPNITHTFRVSTKNVACSGTEVVYKITSISEATFFFYSTGTVLVPLEDYFTPEEYCVSRVSDHSDEIEIKHCEVDCEKELACIYKCCPPHQVVDFDNIPCSDTENSMKWEPVIYKDHTGCGTRASEIKYHLRPIPVHSVDSEFHPYKNIEVESDGVHSEVEGARFRLMDDGKLVVQNKFHLWMRFNSNEFCIDGMTGFVGNSKYKGDIAEQVILELVPKFDEEEPTNQTMVNKESLYKLRKTAFYITMMLIGALFLLGTTIVYLLIWEKHNIHGWTIFAFVATMFTMFILLITSHSLSLTMTDEFASHPACTGIGVAAHFFYLAAMSWLTVINIDLWLTFRNVKPGRGKTQNVARFTLYTTFGYGVPLIVVGFGTTVDWLYSNAVGDGTECEALLELPLYGIRQCYIQEGAYLPYLFIPMMILISCNILTFSSTVFTLCRYQQQTRNVSASGVSHHKESLALFSKLFIVTGISWTLEIFSYFFHDPWWLWIIFDMYNLLQGALIFVIFALKRENFVFLYHKYPRAQFLLLPIMRTSCCYTRTFDPETTEVTTVAIDRNSRIHFRRGSNVSTTSGRSSNNLIKSQFRRDSTD